MTRRGAIEAGKVVGNIEDGRELRKFEIQILVITYDLIPFSVDVHAQKMARKTCTRIC